MRLRQNILALTWWIIQKTTHQQVRHKDRVYLVWARMEEKGWLQKEYLSLSLKF